MMPSPMPVPGKHGAMTAAELARLVRTLRRLRWLLWLAALPGSVHLLARSLGVPVRVLRWSLRTGVAVVLAYLPCTETEWSVRLTPINLTDGGALPDAALAEELSHLLRLLRDARPAPPDEVWGFIERTRRSWLAGANPLLREVASRVRVPG